MVPKEPTEEQLLTHERTPRQRAPGLTNKLKARMSFEVLDLGAKPLQLA